MRTALVQNDPAWGQVTENIDQIFGLMSKERASLYILPEMCYTGYQMRSKDELEQLADSVESENIQRFFRWSKENDAAVILGFPERAADGRIYNSSIFIMPDGAFNIYRKSHLFYKEKLFFEPGNTGFRVIEWRGLKIGQAICFDWYFSESFKTLALMGADLIAHSCNLVMLHCQKVDFARAIENRVFIATVNRIGDEERDGEKLHYTGQSVCVDPLGNYLIDAPKTETGCFAAEIDPALSRDKNLNKYNNLFQDRREIFYKNIH